MRAAPLHTERTAAIDRHRLLESGASGDEHFTWYVAHPFVGRVGASSQALGRAQADAVEQQAAVAMEHGATPQQAQEFGRRTVQLMVLRRCSSYLEAGTDRSSARRSQGPNTLRRGTCALGHATTAQCGRAFSPTFLYGIRTFIQ